MQLQDLAEVEMAVGQQVWPLQAIGPPHGMLRSLRPFLFLDTLAIAESPLTQQLPVSCVLHHLYSRAPPQLQSPHERSGLSPAQVTLHLPVLTSGYESHLYVHVQLHMHAPEPLWSVI